MPNMFIDNRHQIYGEKQPLNLMNKVARSAMSVAEENLESSSERVGLRWGKPVGTLLGAPGLPENGRVKMARLNLNSANGPNQTWLTLNHL